MYIELDGQGARYAQLIRALKAAILESRLAPGSRVPASRHLASELGISRNTVLAAYDQLQAEGFLLARVGSGSFVADIGNRPLPLRQQAAPAVVAPLSAFSRRALAISDGALIPGRQHRDLRFNLQYGLPMTNPLWPAHGGVRSIGPVSAPSSTIRTHKACQRCASKSAIT